jgi:lipid-A-disaccharide synthase
LSSPDPVFLLLAGEPSGDLHGAEVARALLERWPGCRLLGTGGERMASVGVELMAGLDDLAVMGFVEVLGRLPFFWRLERKVLATLEEEGVDLVIPVDYPGFNLRITEKAHSRGVPVLYYIAPQVWAWKEGRTARLARAADRIAVILPFEEELFRKAGGRASFVGHPLLDRPDDVQDREAFCRTWGLDPDRPVLALLPGSRSQEVGRHLEAFLGAAEILRGERPGLQVALARAPSVRLPELDGGVVLVDDSRGLLRHGRAGIVKSGTGTLEAALEGLPFAVAYRTHPLTFALARRLVKVDHVALANLVAGGRVVPELLQNEVAPGPLARAVGPLLDETPVRTRVREGLSRIREKLGEPGAARRVAGLADQILEERSGSEEGP